ncbi:right-handed parallel beta-helix repeat-containing protein [Nostoc sp. KVJ3]|uniref:choice-of-anchor Q domain-containing protein n=1 Tax=Nostoc sp. KVJ3 TaxID=457945 RepID=UPI002238DED6|nr:right-handed parallel beta-helix repeat-containing protein [Nostoc sp. KVJ3]MCW5317973.1 right-handed parallel beta-helix repeat-containing protein [Nostoc sp. KVJ3]
MAGTTYYISGTGNDNHNGLTPATAFRTIAKAVYLPQFKAGDTILIMNGTYDKVGMIFNKNGSPNNWTTIKAYPGSTPKIITPGGGINIFSSSYVRIEGLDIEGGRENITLDYALQQKDNLNNPLTNASGISIKPWKDATGVGGTNPHHIVITGNTIKNFPGGGLGASDSDYITFEKNIVSGNAWYSPYGTQGMGFLRSFNFDNNTTNYRLIIRDNVVYDNQSLVPWYVVGKITEGNGIMLDTVQQAQGGVPYTGKILIANNISYNNGAAGIEVFKALNVDVVNNTLYKNTRVLKDSGEISVGYSTNTHVLNNILYASDNQNANVIKYSTNVTFDRNLVYNYSQFQASDILKTTGLQNILGKDPQFVNAANNNFALKPGSPAINVGSNAFNSITGDGTGIAAVDLGAYLHVGAYQVPTPQIQALNGTVEIADVSTTGINFGDTIVGNTLISKAFTIDNTSTPALNLSNVQHLNEFSLVSTLPTSPILLTSSAVVLLIILTQNIFRAFLKVSFSMQGEKPESRFQKALRILLKNQKKAR